MRAMGIARVHSALELANFSAGTGTKRFSLPYHVVRMNWDRSGDSKRTVGWNATLADALAEARTLSQMGGCAKQGGADTLRCDRITYYVRDVRDGKVYKI